MRRDNHYRTAGVFLLLVAVLLTGTILSYRATTHLGESDRMVAHTYDVIGAIDGLISTLQRAQNTATDFVATGKNEYLIAFRTTSSRMGPGIEQIRTLTEDNPEQQRAIANVEKGALQLKRFLENAIDNRLQGRLSQPTGELQRGVAQNLRAMKTRELELLAQRSAEAALNLRTTRVGLLAGAAINCVLLLLAALMVARDQKQRSLIETSRLRLAAIVDYSEDAIISKSLDGIITSWNRGAERLYGYKAEDMIGKSIYGFVPDDRQEELQNIMQRLRQGERIDHLETVRLRHDGTPVEVELTVSPLKDDTGTVVEASAIGRDITERKLLERSLHQLSVRILRAQDEERRRIAREIHDSTVQRLALLSMNLTQLKRLSEEGKTARLVESSVELTTQCLQELRTLSYVLHPPMLDELGLPSALKIYVEGIAQRSGLEIVTEVDPDFQRLDMATEMALFRVAQESLGNVLRHSGSKTARIRLFQEDGILLTISDKGKGIPEERKPTELPADVGVGIAGMNERIRQLGGVLTIVSGAGGTTVTAYIPERASRAAKRA